MLSKLWSRLQEETKPDCCTPARLTTPRLSLALASFTCLQVLCSFPINSHVIETRVPEIHEEAGAFTVADIDTAFTLVMPTQDQYESYDIRADIKKFKDIGDASRIAMILQVFSHLFKVIGSAISDFSGGCLNKAEGLLVQS